MYWLQGAILSLDLKSQWALSVLEKNGLLYDSSIFPAKTPLYGVSSALVRPYKPSVCDLTVDDADSKLWEFPLTVYSLLGLRIPAAGGFYLRFMPNIVRKAIKKTNKREYPAVIYVHNWELDHQTPKQKLSLYKSFVTYHNLTKTLDFLRALLSEFQFTSFADYMRLSGMV